MNDKNISILKLIIFQSSFVFMNLEKNVLDLKDLNWFYQFYQIFFFKLIKFLNLNKKDLEKIFIEKNIFINKKDYFDLYKNMYDYIENNKNDYNLLTI